MATTATNAPIPGTKLPDTNILVDGETPKTTDEGVLLVSIADSMGQPTDSILVESAPIPTFGTPLHYDDRTVSSTAVAILGPNLARKSALIQNVGSANIRVTWDGSTPTATHGHQIASGAVLSLDQPFVPTGLVQAIREGSVDSSVSVSEVV